MKNFLKRALIIIVVLSINSIIWNAIDEYLLKEELSNKLQEKVDSMYHDEKDTDDFINDYINEKGFTSNDEI